MVSLLMMMVVMELEEEKIMVVAIMTKAKMLMVVMFVHTMAKLNGSAPEMGLGSHTCCRVPRNCKTTHYTVPQISDNFQSSFLRMALSNCALLSRLRQLWPIRSLG